MNSKKELPDWANKELSQNLTDIASMGENQFVDFKSKLDRNERMAKEIASFATSNEGTIYIGIDDEGNIIGISNGFDSNVRKDLIERLEKICSGCIKPAVTPSFEFAVTSNSVILAIKIKKGPEPLYYSTKNIPYVRNYSQALPAEPSDVYQIFNEYFKNQFNKDSKPDPDIEFASELMKLTNDINKIIDQTGYRVINPWLDYWKDELRYIAEDLRELSSTSSAIENKMEDDILELADQADKVSNHPEYLSSGNSRTDAIENLKKTNDDFFSKHLKGIPFDANSYSSIDKEIVFAHNKLKTLLKRSEKLIENYENEELKSVASEIGKKLLEVCYYDIDDHLKGNLSELRELAIKLDVIETVKIYSNVSHSMKEIVDNLSIYQVDLSRIVEELEL